MKRLFVTVSIFLLVMLCPLSSQAGHLSFILHNNPCHYAPANMLHPLYFFADSTCKAFEEFDSVIQKIDEKLSDQEDENMLSIMAVKDVNDEIKTLKVEIELLRSKIELLKSERVMER